jgi:hypothetical protein
LFGVGLEEASSWGNEVGGDDVFSLLDNSDGIVVGFLFRFPFFYFLLVVGFE